MSPAPEVIKVGELEIRFHLDPAICDQTVAVFESVIPCDAHVPAPHRHIGYDETVHGLAGLCHFTLEGREVALGVGDTLFVPRGAVHSFLNRGTETARVLVVVTPGRMNPAYFHEIAAVVNAGRPPDRTRLGEVMRRYGMEPVTAG